MTRHVKLKSKDAAALEEFLRELRGWEYGDRLIFGVKGRIIISALQ
jgi:hypothetical protein